MSIENAILVQMKKAQGETNDRIEKLISEQKRTNELLGELLKSAKTTTV